MLTLCLEQVSLEAHLLTGVKLKCCSVCLKGIRPYKSCVLQTEAYFTQMHPVNVQFHPKLYIESKPKKSETKAQLPKFLEKKEKHPTLFITVQKCICIFKITLCSAYP